MSEIVLNYTGLDNVPGKIVFNKSSDYFEWLNRGKPKNVETLDVEIDEVKANGTYIKVPEKEGGYFDKVVMNVNVPRKSQVTSFGLWVVYNNLQYWDGDIFDLTSGKITVNNITSADVFLSNKLPVHKLGGDATLEDNPKPLTMGYVPSTLTGLKSPDAYTMVIKSIDNFIEMCVYDSTTSNDYTFDIEADSYVMRFLPEIDSNTFGTDCGVGFGFADSEGNPLCGTMFRDHIGPFESPISLRIHKSSLNFSTIYEKWPSFQ